MTSLDMVIIVIFFASLSFVVGYIAGHRDGCRYGMRRGMKEFVNGMVKGLEEGLYIGHTRKVQPGEQIHAWEPVFMDKDGKVYPATRIHKVN